MDIDPSRSSIGIQITLIVLLTAVNAFFAASEMAIVSVNKTKIHAMALNGNKKAQLVERLLKDPTSFLSTIQVGITLAGFFASASAATGISQDFGKFLMRMEIPFGDTIAMICVTVMLSFITLIFGELVPKRIALQKAESLSMFSARPILFLSKAASPFIKILTFTTSLVMKLLRMKETNSNDELSREEFLSMVEAGQETGIFDANETDMINSIFEFDDMRAEDVMTPRVDVFAIDINDDKSEYMDELMQMRYTRVPVYDDAIDNIIGILNMKDYAVEAHKVGFEHVDIAHILRRPFFAIESKKIDDLFHEMQKAHQHIAILIDEYGGFSGILTIEDLIEEIMGDIEDEYDVEDEMLKQLDAKTWIVNGSMELEELKEELNIDLSSEEHDTISGYVIDLLGYIPGIDDKPSLKLNHLIFTILKMDGNRIASLRVNKTLESNDNE